MTRKKRKTVKKISRRIRQVSCRKNRKKTKSHYKFQTKLIMCPPIFFDVIHLGSNPYMTGHPPVNKKKANYQWMNLVSILKKYGCKINLIKPRKNLPDMVFSANSGFILDKTFFPSNFKYIYRRKERQYYIRYFKRLGYTIKYINGIFEGGGDVIYNPIQNHLWIGYGQRTNMRAAMNFKRQISHKKKNVCLLELIDPYFYHLDTCLLSFGDKYALYYPDAFSTKSKQKLLKYFKPSHLIAVTRKEALNFVCNGIEIPDINKKYKGILISNKFSSRLKKKIKKLNYSCIDCSMSEFIKSGGSCACCILEK